MQADTVHLISRIKNCNIWAVIYTGMDFTQSFLKGCTTPLVFWESLIFCCKSPLPRSCSLTPCVFLLLFTFLLPFLTQRTSRSAHYERLNGRTGVGELKVLARRSAASHPWSAQLITQVWPVSLHTLSPPPNLTQEQIKHLGMTCPRFYATLNS